MKRFPWRLHLPIEDALSTDCRLIVATRSPKTGYLFKLHCAIGFVMVNRGNEIVRVGSCHSSRSGNPVQHSNPHIGLIAVNAPMDELTPR